MEKEFIITPEMIAQMKDAVRQMNEFEEGMRERVEIATKTYNSKVGNIKITSGGYEFEIERFLGYIGYHKIDWKPLNSASFESLMHDFYEEEMGIKNSRNKNGTPINEQRILDIERIGKAILHESTPSHQMEEKKTKYSQAVIMMVAKIVNEIEPFLPIDETDTNRKVSLTIDAIYDKLKFRVGNGIGNNFNPEDKLTKNHRKKVVELLNSLGFETQARAFKHKATNR